jgi:DNA-binding transcriptional ArsR family regulator
VSRPVATAADACGMRAAADLFRVLAHPMRLQILCRLLDGEVPVAGLESELGLKQPSLSQQLGQLRDAGIVTTRREAKSIVYSLADERVRALVDALREVMTHARQPRAQAAGTQAAPHPPPRRTPAPAVIATGVVECGVFAVVGAPARG